MIERLRYIKVIDEQTNSKHAFTLDRECVEDLLMLLLLLQNGGDWFGAVPGRALAPGTQRLCRQGTYKGGSTVSQPKQEQNVSHRSGQTLCR